MQRHGNRKRQRSEDEDECSYQNCFKTRWMEPRTGIVHDYCGRTHAELALRGRIIAPHGPCHTCHYRSCDEPVYFEEGRVHEFCSRYHANRAMEEGAWPNSLRSCQGQATPRNKCSLPGCSAPCFRDSHTGVTLDFCGRTHARIAKDESVLGRSEALEPDHVQLSYYGTNTDGRQYSVSLLSRSHPKYDGLIEQFCTAWRHDSAVPKVVRIFQIQNGCNVHGRYRSYLDELETRHMFNARGSGEIGNEMRRFHGTSTDRACIFGIDARARPCSSENCAVCRICSDSFKIRYAGSSAGQVMTLRYGEGLYFSSTSSKSNDYADNSEKIYRGEAYRMMFVCKVAVGAAYLDKEGGMDASALQVKVRDDGFDSVVGLTTIEGGALNHDEVVVFKDEAAIPAYLIVYQM